MDFTSQFSDLVVQCLEHSHDFTRMRSRVRVMALRPVKIAGMGPAAFPVARLSTVGAGLLMSKFAMGSIPVIARVRSITGTTFRIPAPVLGMLFHPRLHFAHTILHPLDVFANRPGLFWMPFTLQVVGNFTQLFDDKRGPSPGPLA